MRVEVRPINNDRAPRHTVTQRGRLLVAVPARKTPRLGKRTVEPYASAAGRRHLEQVETAKPGAKKIHPGAGFKKRRGKFSLVAGD